MPLGTEKFINFYTQNLVDCAINEFAIDRDADLIYISCSFRGKKYY